MIHKADHNSMLVFISLTFTTIRWTNIWTGILLQLSNLSFWLCVLLLLYLVPVKLMVSKEGFLAYILWFLGKFCQMLKIPKNFCGYFLKLIPIASCTISRSLRTEGIQKPRGQSFKDFFHFRTNLRTCPKAWKHALT